MEQKMDSLKRRLAKMVAAVERMEQAENGVPQIEIDILLGDLRMMYDEVLALNSAEPQPAPAPAPEPEPEPIPEPLPEPEPIPEPEPVFAPEPEPAFEAPTVSVEEIEAEEETLPFAEPEPEPEPIPEPEPEPIPEPEPEPIPEPKPEPIPEPKPQQPSLFDLLRQSNATSQEPSHAPRTLADTLQSQGGRNKVTDLRTIININDKFSFMNELFHNNMKAYNDFILKLNTIADRATALAAVEQTAQMYQWNMESLAVKTFYSILDRKF